MPPSRPPEFLQQLLQQTQDHADSLEGLLPESTEGMSDRFLKDLPEQCEQVRGRLESTSNTLSEVILLFDINYGDYIHDCHQSQSNYEEEGHDQLLMTLDSLTSDLENLAIAQQYFATAFMKEELATLSRSLLYIGILAVSLPIALFYQLATYPEASPPCRSYSASLSSQ